MSDIATSQATPVHWRVRLSRHPLIRIALALAFIAAPFALVATPFNLYVSDRSLKRVGAVLLVMVILVSYRAYVRLIEKRPVTELSGPRALRELGAGLLLGALLLSSTIGVLAALGAYQVTGSNSWQSMLVLLPAFVIPPCWRRSSCVAWSSGYSNSGWVAGLPSQSQRAFLERCTFSTPAPRSWMPVT